MKKELILVFLLSLIFVGAQEPQEQIQEINTEGTFDPGVTPESPLYFVDKAVDDVRLGFASEENKALVATEIHNERIAEAQVLAEETQASSEDIQEAISEAQETITIVQEEINPDFSEVVQDSTKKSVEVLTELKETVPEEALEGIENAINQQIIEEKKTEIVAEISKKTDSLCTELIELVGLEQAIEQEPRCNPENEKSQKWLKRKANTDYKEFDENAKKKFFEEMTRCFNDPRECRCNEIPIKSFSNTCHQIIPHVIKCQFEHDENACRKVEEISREDQGMFEDLPEDFRREFESYFREQEGEQFERHAPQECKDAGATTIKECEAIMIKKFAPPECFENNEFIGREKCEQVFKSKYESQYRQEQRFSPEQALEFCLREGKSREECESLIKGFQQPSQEQPKTGYKPETQGIPAGIAFREGEAVPISQEEIQQIEQNSETQIEEINIEEVKQEAAQDLNELESGIETLETAEHQEAAEAISSAETQTSESTPAEASSEAPQESPPPATGSTVKNILKFREKLKK